ncbi:MAG: enoyl-CoA hydratase/isomerase family protein [Deltaproteobacteria bacterium]|nr:enoyl-CoA hydratase/isomerase family protein [Deltaproteobacteria bacterium]
MAKINIEREGHIVVITINRPEVHNSLDPEALIRLSDAWKMVRDDNDIRVAVITGAGEKTFCAGGDLAKSIPLITGARKPEDEWDKKLLENFQDILEIAILRDFDPVKPVIAAINGDCIAGGMEMIQGMDIRVASDTTRFGLAEVKMGLFPGGGSTVRLPRQMPFAKAMEILLTGDLMPAQEALSLGFINYVVPQDKVMGKALEIASRIADNGPIAVRQIRASARSLIGLPESEALAKENKYLVPVIMSKDAKEGPKAFKEKRKPNFIGE